MKTLIIKIEETGEFLMKKIVVLFFVITIFTSIFLFNLKEVSASSQSQILVTQGIMALDDGDYEEALQYFKDAAKADPSDDEALYYLGKTYLKLKKVKEGLRYLNKSTLPEAKFEAGLFFFTKGKFRKALVYFGEYNKEISDETSYFYTGVIYFKSGKLELSRKYLLMAAREPSLKSAASIFLGLIELKKKNFQKAREYFKSAAETGSERIKKKARIYIQELEDLMHPRVRMGIDFGLGGEYDSNVFVLPEGNVAQFYGFPGTQIKHPSSGSIYFSLEPNFQWMIKKSSKTGYTTSLNLSQKLYFSSAAQKYNIFALQWNDAFTTSLSQTSRLIIPLSFSFYYLTKVQMKYANFDEFGIFFAENIKKHQLEGGLHMRGEFYGYENPKNTRRDRNSLYSELTLNWNYSGWKIFTPGASLSFYYNISLSGVKPNDWNRFGLVVSPFFSLNFSEFSVGLNTDFDFSDFTDVNSISTVSGENKKRNDLTSDLLLFFRCKIKPFLTLSGYYTFISDHSNIEVYTYKRTVAGMNFLLSF